MYIYVSDFMCTVSHVKIKGKILKIISKYKYYTVKPVLFDLPREQSNMVT
jgi:hypothetical protein